MTCSSCGADIASWALQCPACGAATTAGQASQSTGAWGPPTGGGGQAGYGWGAPAASGDPWYSQVPAGRAGNLIGWWYRVGATLIDNLLLTVVYVVFVVLFGRIGEIAGIAATVAYQGWFLSNRGQTLGLMAVGGRCVDANTGALLTPGRAYGRAALQVAFSIVLIVGTLVDDLWPLWDGRRQTLHDKAIGSVIVHTR